MDSINAGQGALKGLTAASAKATLVGIILAAAAVEATAANYYVRPALRVGAGELIDGHQTNGPVNHFLSQSVVGYSESEVDLATGTVKMYSENSAHTQGLQTFGAFGDRITINGGAGTTFDLDFQVYGELYGLLEFAAPGGAPPSIWVDVGIVAFAPGVADGTNFFGIANDPCWGQDPLNCTPAPDPLLFDYEGFTEDMEISGFFEGDTDFYQDVFRSATASFTLPGNHEVMDIFAFTNVTVNAAPGAGVSEWVADFSNTAEFSFNTEPGVEVFSSSGQFVGAPAVPVPAAAWLFGSALLGLFGIKRRAYS